MGWASATPIFDGAVDVALQFIPNEPIMRRAVVEQMYTKIDWNDWDTQEESKYFGTDLIHVMWAKGEIDEHHYEWYTSGEPDDWDWDNKGW